MRTNAFFGVMGKKEEGCTDYYLMQLYNRPFICVITTTRHGDPE